jgi:hypothetical protein
VKSIAKKMDFKKYGPWAFYVALVLAVLLAFVPMDWAVWLLAVLGLVVGLLNIDEKETVPFLLASIAWMVAGGFLGNLLPGQLLKDFLDNVVTFVGPAAAVVAIMALYRITKN